jgi:glucosyl-3-phosphoglycerate phosphatase
VTRLIVWRHGNTDWNANERVQGQTDTPLNDRGRQQAAQAAQLLLTLRPDAIVASDLLRASDTAGALASISGLTVTYDKRLRERFFGEWQGMLMTEVASTRPEEYARWRAGLPVGSDVETLDELGARVAAALEAAAQLGDTVVVASHGAAARQGVGHLLGWPAEVLRTLRPLDNCHWIDLVHDDQRGWGLAGFNVGSFAEPDLLR